MNGPRTMMGAVVDGWVLPQDVYSTFSSGKQNDVPMIVGSMAADGAGPAAGAAAGWGCSEERAQAWRVSHAQGHEHLACHDVVAEFVDVADRVGRAPHALQARQVKSQIIAVNPSPTKLGKR